MKEKINFLILIFSYLFTLFKNNDKIGVSKRLKLNKILGGEL